MNEEEKVTGATEGERQHLEFWRSRVAAAFPGKGAEMTAAMEGDREWLTLELDENTQAYGHGFAWQVMATLRNHRARVSVTSTQEVHYTKRERRDKEREGTMTEVAVLRVMAGWRELAERGWGIPERIKDKG